LQNLDFDAVGQAVIESLEFLLYLCRSMACDITTSIFAVTTIVLLV